MNLHQLNSEEKYIWKHNFFILFAQYECFVSKFVCWNLYHKMMLWGANYIMRTEPKGWGWCPIRVSRGLPRSLSSAKWRHNKEMGICRTGKKSSPCSRLAGAFNLKFPDSKTWKISVCFSGNLIYRYLSPQMKLVYFLSFLKNILDNVHKIILVFKQIPSSNFQ